MKVIEFEALGRAGARQRYTVPRNISAASARLGGRPWRKASLSSAMTAVRAAANERSIWLYDIAHDALVELQLTIGGKLDDNAAQHRIVRRLQHDHRQGAQPRNDVRAKPAATATAPSAP